MGFFSIIFKVVVKNMIIDLGFRLIIFLKLMLIVSKIKLVGSKYWEDMKYRLEYVFDMIFKELNMEGKK